MEQVRHNAPAGQTYSSIQDAGRSTLETHCDNYPGTSSSFILPNLFPSSFREVIDNPQVTLTDKQKRKFDGFMKNLDGEREEYDIYLAFASLTRRSLANQILVIWALKFDSDNSRAIKRNALRNELPSIQLGPGEMSREKDFIIFVRDCGVVFGEVKRSATPVNIDKAEEQSGNAEKFFQKLMRAISGPNGPVLPTSKLILVPGESEPSPAAKTPSGCHLVYHDVLQNFGVKWKEVVDELKEANSINPINPTDFIKLVQIVTGIWSMKPLQKKFFEFNNDQASLAFNIQSTDKSISDAILCSEKGAPFSANSSLSSITEVSSQDPKLNVIHFSPQQKLIFENYRHALIRAHAGCGKTLLVLLKILDILEKDPSQKILLVAKRPHHLRCKKILEKNNVTVEIYDDFPSFSKSSPLFCDVVIVEMQKFFGVKSSLLLQYDLSLYNLFVDDLHGYEVRRGDYSNFTDIGDFIEYVFSESKKNDMLCWFGIDIGQQLSSHVREEKKASGLFLTQNGSKRDFNIPIVEMDQILRNSKEIVQLLESARKEQAGMYGLDNKMMIKNIRSGHHITSQKVICHKVSESKYWNCSNYLEETFVCARIKELIGTLSTSSSSSPSFDFSSFAILSNRNYFYNHNDALEEMLSTAFNLEVQTIEDSILSNNGRHVVMDTFENAQSFETAVLVYVRSEGEITIAPEGGSYDYDNVYNILSRARTICVIIDVYCGEPHLPLENIDLVNWEAKNGTFRKLT